MGEQTTIAKLRASLAALALCLLPAVGFAEDDLRIEGTGEGLDIVEGLCAAFMAYHPNIYVLIPSSTGSDGGVSAVRTDKAVLGRVARPLSLAEQAHGLIYTPVFRLASAIYVHPSVTITNLSTTQLVDIFSGHIANWREVGGPDLRIKVVRRQEDESTVTVLRETMPGWSDLKFTERSRLALTAQESIRWVSEVDGAVGIGTYSRNLEPRLRILKIHGRHPSDPDYPSEITIGFIHREATITEPAKAFLAFMALPKAKALVTNMGGIPFSE